MINATTDKDNILIDGTGGNFLKLKHEISQIIPPEEIIFTSRKSFSLPFKYLNLVYSTLINFGCVFADEFINVVGSIRTKHLQHERAKKIVLQVQEEGKSLTGSSYWDQVLFPHQGIAVNCMVVEGLLGICLFDEQGTGKTINTIAAFDIIKSKKKADLLFLIGPKSLLGNWRQETDKYLKGKYNIIELDGSQENKLEKLHTSGDIYLMNYETIDSLLIPLTSVAKDYRTILAVDESYFIKNPYSKRASAIRRLRPYCIKAFVLCGTPAPNKPYDIVHQFDVADDGFTFLGFSPTDNEEKDKIEILYRIEERGVFLRRTKTEVWPKMPDKNFKIIEVYMTDRQEHLYEKAKKELVLYLRNLDNITFKRNLATYFQKRATLLQICVSPKLIDKTYDEIPAKFKSLDKIVSEVVQQKSKKIIIWSVYTRSIDEIESRYKKYGIVRVDGTVKTSAERIESVEAFQKDPNVRIFVGNPAAAGAGLTLHAASDCVYVSFSNQAAHYLQSLDRIHRFGQLSPHVNYYFLICKNSIEGPEIKRLCEKEKNQKDLLQDSMDKGFTLEMALSELGVN